MATNKGLGKGLSALFTDAESDYNKHGIFSDNPESGSTVSEIEISSIYPNPDQPRKAFNADALNELASSIETQGVITPLVLHKTGDRYMIIAGERRYRAAKKAGLKTVPAVVREYTDRQIKEISLIENLQREDLNPIEAATAIKQLMTDYSLSQEEVADRIGKSRPSIANSLRLLTLSPDVIKLVLGDKLSAGHARSLITLPRDKQLVIAEEAVKGDWSVREIERKCKELTEGVKPKKTVPKKEEDKPKVSVELSDLIGRMQRVLGTKVSLVGNNSMGRISIDYYSRDDLDRIAEKIEILERKHGK